MSDYGSLRSEQADSPTREQLHDDIRLRLARARGMLLELVHRATHDDSARRELEAWQSREIAAGWPSALSALDPICRSLRQFARGPAGSAWDRFSFDPAEGGGGLYRLGQLLPPPTVGTVAAWNAPALIGVLGYTHLRITGTPVAHQDSLVTGLLTRMFAAVPPGGLRVTVYDPYRLGGHLRAFAGLAGVGLFEVAGQRDMNAVLDLISGEIQRIQSYVLAGQYGSLAELIAATGTRPEPWRVLVVYPPDGGLRSDQQMHLNAIAEAGLACGVHVIACEVPLAGRFVEHVQVSGTTAAASGLGAEFRFQVDPMPAPELVARVCAQVAGVVSAGPPPVEFDSLLPAGLWASDSLSGVSGPIGRDVVGAEVIAGLGDAAPHALVVGPSGSGKTNLLYAFIGSLTARYSPDELELYLLDFKQGVSFQMFAPQQRDPSWLPHARLVGVNVNTDLEFGLALLRHLAHELQVRADAARRWEVSALAGIREHDRERPWPRIVAVIDECQELLKGRDPITMESVRLLDLIARQGRSFGIHLVLASQDLSEAESLWGRSAIVEQFLLRIALPRARRVLADDNSAAAELPRFQAIVNAEKGIPSANRIARIPASEQPVAKLQERLWRQRNPSASPPILFDGNRIPRLLDNPAFTALAPHARSPIALVGQAIDLSGSAAASGFGPSMSRNVAVFGMRPGPACDVLATAALSLARQYAAQQARFTVVCLDDAVAGYADQLSEWLSWQQVSRVAGSGFADFADGVATELGTPATTGPHYVVVLAAENAVGVSEDVFTTLISRGPIAGVHLLVWSRSVARLKDLLGYTGRMDDFGVWVGLDVHGAELAPLVPGMPLLTWEMRERRGLYFDRSVHREPQTVIPFQVFEETR